MELIGIQVIDTSSVVLAAVLASLGLLLIIAGWFGLIPAFGTGSSIDFRKGGLSELAIRIVLTAVGSFGLWAFTGWPVAGFYGGLAGWFFLTLKNAKRERHAAIDRVDAIATWVENLRDNISGSAGLQQALRMSADHAPEPIRTEVRDLVLRLQHEPVTPALRRFAADVAHPTSDMAVGCLILASSRSAGSLASVLAKTAQAARDGASMMRQIDASRTATQSQAKLVAIISGLGALFLITSSRDFVAPYGTFGGQVALFLICGMFMVSAVALYRLAKPVQPERVFRGVETAPVEQFDEVPA